MEGDDILHVLLKHSGVTVRSDEWPFLREAYDKVAVAIPKLRALLGTDDHPAIRVPFKEVGK